MKVLFKRLYENRGRDEFIDLKIGDRVEITVEDTAILIGNVCGIGSRKFDELIVEDSETTYITQGNLFITDMEFLSGCYPQANYSVLESSNDFDTELDSIVEIKYPRMKKKDVRR